MQYRKQKNMSETWLTQDRSKFFNRINAQVVAAVLDSMSMGARLTNAMHTRYLHLVRHFRLGRAFREPLMVTFMVEGCSWSVLVCKCILTALVCTVARSVLAVRVVVSVDDSTLRSPL